MAKNLNIGPTNPELDGIYADIQKFCRDHRIAPNTFFNAIMPKILFCLRHYTRADAAGNPVLTLNLGETTILTLENLRKQRRGKRRRWDSAF